MSAPFKVIDGDVVQTALNAVGQKEQGGSNRGAIAQWSGADGLPWCAGFVTEVFNASGYDEIFEHCQNTLYVPEVMKHGASIGVSDTVGSTPPEEGSVISFKGQSHIGIVTKVHEDGTFDITQGNTSNMVKTITYSMNDFASGHLDRAYLSADKMNGYLPDDKSLTTHVKERGMVGAYDYILESAPENTPDQFFVVLASAILTLFGMEDMVPELTQQGMDGDSSRDVLTRAEERYGSQQTADQGQDVSDPSPPATTPTSNRSEQSSKWL